MAALQCLRNDYANYADPCAWLITPGMVCLTCQHPLTRYTRNRSLLSQLMLLMLLTVTITAPPLPSSRFSPPFHPPSLLASVSLETFSPEAQAFGAGTRYSMQESQGVLSTSLIVKLLHQISYSCV